MGAVENLSVKHPWHLEVVDIDRLSGDLLLSIHLGNPLSDIDKVLHKSSLQLFRISEFPPHPLPPPRGGRVGEGVPQSAIRIPQCIIVHSPL